MTIIPSPLRPLALRCLTTLLLCPALTHAEGEPTGIGQVIPGFALGADTVCNGLTIQPDGKILVGGRFLTLGGIPRTRLARLHPDGRVDLTFNTSADHRTEAMVVLDDGRILIGGLFTTVNGEVRKGIARLHADGSLDHSFDLQAFNRTESTRVDIIRILKLRSGKFLIGGQFTALGNTPTLNIARLNADGSLDTTFTTEILGFTPITTTVYSLFELTDGKLLVGGKFTTVNGVPRFGLARLHEDGTLDTSFADIGLGPYPGPTTDTGAIRVSALLQQPDGKIVIGGQFTTMKGQSRSRIARLNADGTLDGTFTPTANDSVVSLARQEDGNLLAAGFFTQMAGQARLRVAKILPDGSLDPDFQPQADGTVSGITVDRQGKVWITGEFNTVGGVDTKGVTKLENSTGTMELGMPGSSSAFWSVTGTAPALRDVSFELSADGGTAWTPLGAGTKVTGGWSLEGLALPPHGFLRAKGNGLSSNRTHSFLEDTLLFGRQPTKLEEWRMEQFGSFTNQRTGADLADADGDGVANLMEYAFNLDPQDATSAQVPAWTNDGSKFEINFTPPANVEGVSYGVEWSSSMNPSDWHEVTNQGTGDGHRYVVPKDATPLKFMRVKVTITGSLPPP